jgi:hypothetical protein
MKKVRNDVVITSFFCCDKNLISCEVIGFSEKSKNLKK